jgi:hypothetical protein
MVTRIQVLTVLLLVIVFGAVGALAQQEAPKLPPAPPARKIPGINAKDEHPHGCVDCHKNNPAQKMDNRFSTLIREWQEKVPAELLEKAKQAAPRGMEIEGKHPKVRADLTTAEIPKACFECHAEHPRNKKNAGPPFTRLVHLIHLVGGEDNHFMTYYQGECTNCHKLDQKTGQWSLGSGSEDQPHEHGH